MQVYLKHSMSCLSDQAMQLEVDHEQRVVRLAVKTFDSSLVATLVVRDLPGLVGADVVAYRDDARKNDAWLTQPARYRLVIVLAGLEFEAQVVKLVFGGVAVTLEPLREHLE
jgi:hypothetical protein